MAILPKFVRNRNLRDNKFLAERIASLTDEFTQDHIEQWLATLSDEQYRKTFRETFIATTTINLTYGALACAEQGWFVDINFPGAAVGEIGKMIEDGQASEAFVVLEAYFEERLDEIEQNLVGRFKKRESVLRMCLRLFREANYDASIPLCLIQADGICHDIYGDELFRVRSKRPRVSLKLKGKKVDWIWDALSHPLRELLPLVRHENPGSSVFNRHLIMHGHDLSYGTKGNGLRSISLLSYLCGMAEYEEVVKARVV